eukprot:974611_1
MYTYGQSDSEILLSLRKLLYKDLPIIWTLLATIFTTIPTHGTIPFPEQMLYSLRSDNPRKVVPPHEEILFRSVDGTQLHGWFVRAPPNISDPVTVLYCHGAVGTIMRQSRFLIEMPSMLNVNVFAFDYRGYGRSKGTPNERGLIWDVRAALSVLLNRTEINHHKIIAYGRSLGGAVAIALAQTQSSELLGLILENTFTSIEHIVKDHLRHTFGLVSRLSDSITRIPWDSLSRITNVTCPILFISGQLDKVVPPYQMDLLYKSSNKTIFKRIVRIKNGSHKKTWDEGGAPFWVKCESFIHKILKMSNNI